MSNKIAQGIVEAISKSDKNGFYSFFLAGDWYGAGKYQPKFNRGDEIKFEYSSKFHDGKEFKNLVFNTVVVVESGKDKDAAQEGNKTAASYSSPVDWDKKDKRITYLACQKDALQLLQIGIGIDVFPKLPVKKEDKYDALREMVKEISQDFYRNIYGEDFSGD